MTPGELIAYVVLGLLVLWLYTRMLRAARKPRTTPKVRRDHTSAREYWRRAFWQSLWW